MGRGGQATCQGALAGSFKGHPPARPGLRCLQPAGNHPAFPAFLFISPPRGEGPTTSPVASSPPFILTAPTTLRAGPAWGQEITVGITGRNVTLTCPTPSTLWWKIKGNWKEEFNCSSPCTIADYQGTQLIGQYGCNSNVTNIYLLVRECPDCVEMDLWVVTGILAADLLFTLGVLILAHYCSRRRAARFGGSPAAGGPRARPRGGQREDRPPPVPNPDYEPIRKGQREVYAGLEPRAF